MLHSLGPYMQDLFGPNDAKVKGELAECLQEPWLLGVFPVGGRWPDEKSIDIRTPPSLAAFRMHALVKSHLSPQAQAKCRPHNEMLDSPYKSGDAALAKRGQAGR